MCTTLMSLPLSTLSSVRVRQIFCECACLISIDQHNGVLGYLVLSLVVLNLLALVVN